MNKWLKRLDNDPLRISLALGALLAVIVLWRAELLPAQAAQAVEDVRNDGLNAVGMELLTRNYYEELTDEERVMWERGAGLQAAAKLFGGKNDEEGDVGINSSGATQPADPFIGYEFAPNKTVPFKGATLSTNRWGMRDEDCELKRPAGVFRIVLLGGSNAMGSGVEQPQCFAELLEDKLNEQLAGKYYDRYEVLNFGIGGQYLLSKLYLADKKAPKFQPQLVICEVTEHDLDWSVVHDMAKRLANEIDIPYATLRDIAERAGVEPGDSVNRGRQRLTRYREPLVTAAFREMNRIGKENNMTMAAMIIRLRVGALEPALKQEAAMARAEELVTLEVLDAYENRSAEEMYLSPADQHPSVLGHRLLADELFDDMMADPMVRALLRGPDTNAKDKDDNG